MTIGGAIEDIKSWDIPFYCEKSREKVIETIVEAYQEGAASERSKAFSNGYESGYNKGRQDVLDELIKKIWELQSVERPIREAIGISLVGEIVEQMKGEAK